MTEKTERTAPKGTIVSTPFPYAYGVPHLGNLTQVIKSDLYAKIKNVLDRDRSEVKSDTSFCYSFHATGLPIYLRIKALKSRLRGHFRDKTRLRFEIREFFKENNLSPVLPYVKRLSDCLTLKGWIHMMKNYYTDLFLELGVQSNLPLCHTTTEIDENYSLFVNTIYEELNRRGLILQKENYLIYCDKCEGILGDHDRTRYEGLGVSSYEVHTHSDREKRLWISDRRDEDSWMRPVSQICLSKRLFLQLKRNTPPHSEILLYRQKCVTLDPEKMEQESQTREMCLPVSETIHSASAEITCRCGGSSKIGKENTLFLNFSKREWKDKVTERVTNSDQEPSDKKTLLSRTSDLRDVAFLRSDGYGTRLKFLRGTPFQDKMVDSLSDSALHPYFYSCFLENKYDDIWNTVPSYEYLVHNSGRDLLQNHLLYMYFFSVELFPQVEVPHFDTTRFICAPDREKMSKSLNNVIYWDHIKKVSDVSGLRCYLASLADSSEPTQYDEGRLRQRARSGRRHKSQFQRCVKSKVLKPKELEELDRLLRQMSLNVSRDARDGPHPRFKLRLLYHKLFSEILNVYLKADCGPSDLQTLAQEKLSLVVRSLMECFVTSSEVSK